MSLCHVRVEQSTAQLGPDHLLVFHLASFQCSLFLFLHRAADEELYVSFFYDLASFLFLYGFGCIFVANFTRVCFADIAALCACLLQADR